MVHRYNVSILYDVLYRQRPMKLLNNLGSGVIQVINIPVPA